MKVIDPLGPDAPVRPQTVHEPWRDDQDPIDVYKGLMFLWRARLLIALVTAGAILLGGAAALMLPAEYTALSTVFVSTSRPISQLEPEPMTVDAFEQLAMSQLVLAEVEAELVRANAFGAGESITRFRTVLYRGSQPQSPYLPILGLSVTATSPELAQAAANHWSAVLVRREAELSDRARSAAADYIVQAYPRASAQLLEDERRADDLRTKHLRELDGVKRKAAVSVHEAQLKGREELLVKLEEDRHMTLVELADARGAVAGLEAALATVPPLLVASKGPTDEAWWQSVLRDPQGAAKLGEAQIRSEEINPAFVELMAQLGEARAKRDGLAARAPALDAQIARVRAEANESLAALGRGEVAVAETEGRQAAEVAAAERDVGRTRAMFMGLQDRIGDAQLATGSREPALSMGVTAEAPLSPSGPARARLVGLVGLLGLVIAAAAAWITDRTRRSNATA